MNKRIELIQGNVYPIDDIKEYLFQNSNNAVLLSDSISDVTNQKGDAKVHKIESLWLQKAGFNQYRTIQLSQRKSELIYVEKID